MSKLNSRQWKLYNFVKELTLNGEWATKEIVAQTLGEYYHIEINKHNTYSFTNCPLLYKDIRKINLSDEIEKIIVVDNNRIYLGTKETATDYAIKLKARAIMCLKRYWNIYNKIMSDGNGKLVSCKGDIITQESKAREFVEAFVGEMYDK